MSAPAHAAVLLAAGASRRLGQPKALVEVDGEPLVRRTARHLAATAPHVLIVVTGEATLGERIDAALAGIPFTRVACPAWAQGMGASLRAGLDAAGAWPVAAALACPCDLPRLSNAHLDALLAAWRADPHRAAACRYEGIVGAPAILPRTAFDAITRLDDRGARDWLRAQADVAQVDAPALAFDLDRPEDLPGHRDRR